MQFTDLPRARVPGVCGVHLSMLLSILRSRSELVPTGGLVRRVIPVFFGARHSL